MKIKKLSKETINLISAGEVIDGPSDVLKELIENSVDAKATEILIEVKNSGIDLINIKDNGVGILKEDLKVCLEKYTTSKLETIDDLYSLDSFGFRGEALSTIDAVSKLKIISSTNKDGSGFVLEYNNISEISASQGTNIIIEDLFYNVPVRKKFLKSTSSEFSKIYEVFLANVLLNPDITFKFISEKKNVVFSKTTLENRYIQIYGSNITSKTVPINVNNDFFTLTGILTNPTNSIYLSTNFLFINKRFVFSPQIYKTITSAYKDYLMIQQKPFFILFITLNSNTIDVNVHPKKRVVKLQNEMLFLIELKKELSKILDGFLGKSLPVTNYNSLSDFVSFNKSITYNSTESTNNFKSNGATEFINKSQKNLFADAEFKNNFSGINKINLFEFELSKILGQINNTFIVCETKDGMLLVDQHAADERINLEKNRKQYDFVEKQSLISEILLDGLSERYIEILNNKPNIFEKIGFSYIFKNNNFYLKSIPLFLNRYFDKNVFVNILKDIDEGTDDVLKLKDNLLKLKSCKESIKGNQLLSFTEQVNLIRKLNECSDKGICAHGRPTIIFVSIKDLEKGFKRIV